MTYGIVGYSGNQSGPAFAPLALGAGGFITGLDVHSDGTLIGRTDTYGAYLGSVTAGTKWQSILNIASMPTNSVGFDANGNFAPGIGVYEIRVAPSNSSIFYMLYSDGVAQRNLSMFKSVNKGTTWTKLAAFTALSVTWVAGGENNAYRVTGQKMAIHPTDPNTVLVGTPANGLYYTTDGGGSFTHITGVATSSADGNSVNPGITGICFDPATPTTCYAASFGNGVYKSTTGVTGTWSLLTSSPQFVAFAVISAGNYWCAGKSTSSGVVGAANAPTLFTYNGSSFSANGLTPDGNGVQSICFVTSSTIIVTTSAGSLWVSTNTGGAWAGVSYVMPIQSPADVPWLTQTSISFFSGGPLVADPITSGRIIQGIGTGVITVNMTWSSYAFNTTTPWVSQSAGIEQLVARKIISPPGGTPIIAVEDRGCFYISNPAVYQSDYSTRPLSTTTCASWDVDYAKSSHSTIAQVSNYQNADVSGLSSSSGQNGTWSAFATSPVVSSFNGNIAISTPTNIVFFNTFADTAPKYTTNGGSTWNACSGLPTTGWAPGSFFDNQKIICADDAGNGTFYIYNDGARAIYRSTDNGANWTSILTSIVRSFYFEPTLISVPGQAGHLFWAPGINGSSNLPIGNALYRSQNANGGSPSLTTVSNVQDVWAIGFGAVAAGQSYPTVWIVGWVKVGAAAYKYGIWVSKDNCVSWTFLIDYPFNSCDQIVTISGDASDPAKCYFGFQGSGAGYGHNLVY